MGYIIIIINLQIWELNILKAPFKLSKNQKVLELDHYNEVMDARRFEFGVCVYINSLLYESLLYEGRFFMPLLSLGMSRWFGLPLISLPPLPSQCPVQLQSTPECLVENMANFAMFLRWVY